MSETKKKNSVRADRGPPKMRVSVAALRKISTQAQQRLEQEALEKKSREEQDRAREAARQRDRDIEAARKILGSVSRLARKAAIEGRDHVEALRLTSKDYFLTYPANYPSRAALVGPAAHVYDALDREGFAVDIVLLNHPEDYCIRIRWA